jgi:hypothetical protein
MSKNAQFPTLSALPFTTVSGAPCCGEEQIPMTSTHLPPSLGDTSGGPHGREATRRARGSEDSAKAWARGRVLNR